MSRRLTPFTGADLVELQDRINGIFPSGPPDGLGPIAFDHVDEAVPFDPTVLYAPDDIVLTESGLYSQCLATPAAWDSGTEYAVGQWVSHSGSAWYCLATDTGTTPGTDPTVWVHPDQGLPATHTTYWQPLAPAGQWIAEFNRVRQAVRAAVEAAAAAQTSATDFRDVMESLIVSGPWPIGQQHVTTGGVTVTRYAFGVQDSAARSCTLSYYAMWPLELYGLDPDIRLDLTSGVPSTTCYLGAYGATGVRLRFKCEFSPEGRLTGTISVGVIVNSGSVNVTGPGSYDPVTGYVTWTWSDAAEQYIDIALTVDDGYFDGAPVFGVGVVWRSAAAEVATNVLSHATIYRAEQSAKVGILLTAFEDDGLGGLTDYAYADGANVAPITAAMVNYSPDDRDWCLRAKTHPAYSVSYWSELVPWNTPLGGGVDFPNQRQWYPLRPQADPSTETTLTTGQEAILELDMLCARRDRETLDQTRPIVDRADGSGTYGEAAVAVGFYRGTTWVELAAWSIPTHRLWAVKDLGRTLPILAWRDTLAWPTPDPIPDPRPDRPPLRWTGSGVQVSAVGVIALGVPGPQNGWSWVDDNASNPAQCVGYLYTSACHVDDLWLVLAGLP